MGFANKLVPRGLLKFKAPLTQFSNKIIIFNNRTPRLTKQVLLTFFKCLIYPCQQHIFNQTFSRIKKNPYFFFLQFISINHWTFFNSNIALVIFLFCSCILFSMFRFSFTYIVFNYNLDMLVLWVTKNCSSSCFPFLPLTLKALLFNFNKI